MTWSISIKHGPFSRIQFAKLDRLLRKEKKMMDVPFGGVHILLSGDFLQLPPVASAPLDADPKAKRKWTTTDISAFELWRTFTTVVILEESVRFRADPEWGKGCKAARLVNWTPEFLKTISSQVVPSSVDPTSTLDIGQVTSLQTVFASPENSTRIAINNQFTVKASTKMAAGSYPIRVVANFKWALTKLCRSEINEVMNLPDSRFGRMAPFIDLIPGLPIQITQNVRPTKGVANGTLGVLIDVIFKASAKFRVVRDSTSGILVKIPSEPPIVTLERVDRGPGAKPINEMVGTDVFPLFYATEGYTRSNIKLAPAPNGIPRCLALKIQQFPFVCAVGSTTYKVQGETFNSLVVVDWKSSVSFANKPQQNYLLVSRVTSRNALLALKPFPAEIAAWSKPPQDAIDEENRLLDLSEKTIQQFYS